MSSRLDRGQTGLDFVIGIGLFLLAMGFLVAFAPNLVASHTESPELPLVADRAANYAVDAIGTDANAFFAAKEPLVDGYQVKVVLVESDGGVRTYETASLQGSSSKAIARRVVDVNGAGDTAYLTVEVWR